MTPSNETAAQNQETLRLEVEESVDWTPYFRYTWDGEENKHVDFVGCADGRTLIRYPSRGLLCEEDDEIQKDV
jgi:hypothetical protein